MAGRDDAAFSALMRLQEAAFGLPADVLSVAPHRLLRLLRVMRGLSVTAVARRLDLAASGVSRLECGLTDPAWSRLQAAFGALDCDLVVLPMHRRDRWPETIWNPAARDRAHAEIAAMERSLRSGRNCA